MTDERANIAFIGRAAAGKSTATKILQDAYGYTRVGFADPIRALQPIHNANENDWSDNIRRWAYEYRIPDVLDPYGLEQLERGILKAFYKYPRVEGKNRDLLQNIGTEVGRGIDDWLWIKTALNLADTIDGPAVLDDCRFANEAESLINAGWVLAYLHVRESVLDARYAATYGSPMSAAQKAHPSESGIAALRQRCHTVIDNNDDSLVSLYNQVEFLVETAHLTLEVANT